MNNEVPLTAGVHHAGLTVADLEVTAGFFTGILGWREVRRDADYPAVFVSDGTVMLSLWRAKAKVAADFDKDAHIGLHHLALRVGSEQALQSLHGKLQAAGVAIEFSPEPVRGGPAMHMMCYEPGGIRIEFIYAP